MSSSKSHTFTDNYGALFEPVIYKITLVVITIFCGIVGIGLHVGIIHYEKLGGDPQKRSATNQLTSVTCVLYIVMVLLTFSASNWRTWIGPLTIPHAQITLILFHWLVHVCLLTSLEILFRKLFKILDVAVCKGIDDNWLAVFLTLLNLLLAGIAVTVKVRSGVILDYDFYLLTGEPLSADKSTRLGFRVPPGDG